MVLPGMSSLRGAAVRRAALWSTLAAAVVVPTVGCQVEYAGMTLPSGKYMHDDVQYFPSGPEFPWANTQAATQRARMRSMGIDVPQDAAITNQRVAPGVPGVQNQLGQPTDINASPLNVSPPPAPGANAPNAAEVEGGVVPPPPPPANP